MTRNYADIATSSMTDEELLAALREIEQRRRADYARELAVLAELDGRDTAARHGYRGVAALVREVLRLNPAEARRRLAHARTFVADHTPTGLPLAPELPDVGAVLADGLIDPAHAEAIRATVARFPRPLYPPDVEAAQRLLVKAATDYAPRLVTRLGKVLVDRLDQDGAPWIEKEPADPYRSLDLREDQEGRLRGRFVLDPETGTLLAGLIEPRAKRRARKEGPHRRGKDERQGDALAELVRIAAGCPEQGRTGAREPIYRPGRHRLRRPRPDHRARSARPRPAPNGQPGPPHRPRPHDHPSHARTPRSFRHRPPKPHHPPSDYGGLPPSE